ncbi:hypothetical protein B0I35DRAFT_43501 [Stachybotrys elegans]|uniref:Uncharacterized protein n=1 Tax=Stachybotrys elegans TaxID=80388 RepID=A0A8K0T791_9HYPO|nr:hypothetical protein B0I35DRAFT_43501 [Stachybotrys elegans]
MVGGEAIALVWPGERAKSEGLERYGVGIRDIKRAPCPSRPLFLGYDVRRSSPRLSLLQWTTALSCFLFVVFFLWLLCRLINRVNILGFLRTEPHLGMFLPFINLSISREQPCRKAWGFSRASLALREDAPTWLMMTAIDCVEVVAAYIFSPVFFVFFFSIHSLSSYLASAVPRICSFESLWQQARGFPENGLAGFVVDAVKTRV